MSMKFRENMEIVCTVLPSRTEELMSEPERLSLFYYYGAGLSFGIVSLPWIFRVCLRPNMRIRPSKGKRTIRTKCRGPSSLCSCNQGVRIEYLGGTPNVRLPNNPNGMNRPSRRVSLEVSGGPLASCNGDTMHSITSASA